jgi:hypothetical protein
MTFAAEEGVTAVGKLGCRRFENGWFVREPDAGKPPVRFDEREIETEHGMRLLRHRRGNPDTEYVEAYPTAPPLDSTLFPPRN